MTDADPLMSRPAPRPHNGRRTPTGNPYRAHNALIVAIALAELGCRLFPTHGMRKARTPTGVECDCMKGRRYFAQCDDREVDSCPSPGKLPRVKGWPYEASNDPNQLRDWRKKAEGGWPHANFGVVTGSASDLW